MSDNNGSVSHEGIWTAQVDAAIERGDVLHLVDMIEGMTFAVADEDSQFSTEDLDVAREHVLNFFESRYGVISPVNEVRL